MEHLDLETIQAYIYKQLPEDEVKLAESHLAECSECLGLYSSIMTLEKGIKSAFSEERPSDSCPEEWEIAAVIKKESPQDISEKIKAHINECGFCMERAAVHYKAMKAEGAPVKTPDAWKKKALSAVAGPVKAPVEEPQPSFIERMQEFFQGLAAAPIPALAGYGVAILAVGILIYSNFSGQGEFMTIASSEKLMMRDAEIPSTFGFSGAGETIDVKIMELSVKGDRVFFKWKGIEEADKYLFSLKDRTGTVHTEDMISEPEFSINKDMIDQGKLYSWLITGKTLDGKYFEYTGEFVFVK